MSTARRSARHPPHLRRGVLWLTPLLIQEGWRAERRGGSGDAGVVIRSLQKDPV